MGIPSPPHDKFDLLKHFLDDLPTEGAEREEGFLKASRRLHELAGRSDPRLLQELALPLARDALFDLRQGFSLGGFRDVSGVPMRLRSPRPGAQEILEEVLRNLVVVETARAEVFDWAVASLHQQVGHLLRQRLASAEPTWNPIRLFTRLRGRLSLALLEVVQTPQRDENPEYELGLSLLHLLFEASGEIRPQELETIIALAREWVEAFPYFPEEYLRDLMRSLRGATSLPPQESERLVNLFLAWRDMERYPPARTFASRRQYIQAMARWARAQGYGKWFVGLVSVIMLFRSRSSFSLKTPEPWEIRRDQARRLASLTLALGILALTDERLFPVLLQEIRSLLGTGDEVEAKFALLEAIPAFLCHPQWIDSLAEAFAEGGQQEFGSLWERDLDLLNPQVSRPALEVLLNLIHRDHKTRWPRQILEHAGSLRGDGENWLCQQIPLEDDPQALESLFALHQHLVDLKQPASKLENALRKRIEAEIGRDRSVIPDSWIRWLLGLKNEVLRRLISSLTGYLKGSSDSAQDSVLTLSKKIAAVVCHAEKLTPLKLVICWLINPQDQLASGLSLEERLRLATDMMRRGYFDEGVAVMLSQIIPQAKDVTSLKEELFRKEGYPGMLAAQAHPRLADVLLESLDWSGEYMRTGAARRLALPHALSRSGPPELALPILDELFQIACEMLPASRTDGERVYPELFRESRMLAEASIETLATLEPVMPKTVALLGEMLLAQYHDPEGDFFSPAYVWETLLPMLANRHVASESVPALLKLLTRPMPPEEQQVQCIWQCALQWLTNVSLLSEEQQELIWNVGYASPVILTRSLALLALGQQRSLRERTWQTTLNLLRTSWWNLYQSRAKEISRLGDRHAWFILGPGDAFLLAGVAVALTAEWYAEPGLLTPEQRSALQQALQRAASSFNRVLEARLAESTHPLTGKDYSNAQGLARSLCTAIGKEPEDDPDWLIHPANLAQELLRKFPANKEKRNGPGLACNGGGEPHSSRVRMMCEA